MKTVTFRNSAPKLFATVRGSRDVSLVAFGAALLAGAALHLGAFIPRFGAPEGSPHQAAAQVAATMAAPAEVAAAKPAPCALPRG